MTAPTPKLSNPNCFFSQGNGPFCCTEAADHFLLPGTPAPLARAPPLPSPCAVPPPTCRVMSCRVVSCVPLRCSRDSQLHEVRVHTLLVSNAQLRGVV